MLYFLMNQNSNKKFIQVGDQLAQMGAATAQVVQLTAVADEVDSKVGTAIATIGSNMPEMGRGVRELAALMPDEQRRGMILVIYFFCCKNFRKL